MEDCVPETRGQREPGAGGSRLVIYMDRKKKKKKAQFGPFGEGLELTGSWLGKGDPGRPILKMGPLCHLAGESWGGNKSGLLPRPVFGQHHHSPGTQYNLLNLQTCRERKVARQRDYGNILSVTWTLLQTRKFSHSCHTSSDSRAPNADCSSHLTTPTESAALGLIGFLFPFSFHLTPPAGLHLEMISLFPFVRPCGSHTYLGWLFPHPPAGEFQTS